MHGFSALALLLFCRDHKKHLSDSPVPLCHQCFWCWVFCAMFSTVVGASAAYTSG